MSKPGLVGLLLWAVLLAHPLTGRAGDGDNAILIIANKAIAASTLSREDLRPIFQTKRNTLPDGTLVRPFNLPESDSVRRGFDAAVLGLDPDRVARYWIDRKIRGGDRPPQIAPSGAVMVKVVGKTPGAIGYVGEGVKLDASVKVLAKVTNGQVVNP